MRVLYISDYILEKNIGAYQLCRAHLQSLNELVGKENVDVIALTGNKDYSLNEYRCLKSFSSKKEKLKNLMEFNNPFINNKIIRYIISEIEKNTYDIVFIDNSIFGKLVRNIKKRFKNIKIITFYHDVKRNLCREWLHEYGIKYFPDYIVNIWNEKLNVKYSNYNITLNKRESDIYKKYYKKDPELEIPIYLKDEFHNKEVRIEEKKKFVLLFVGAYYYPNVKGVKWLGENVIEYLNNDIELRIVGRGMERLKEEIDFSGLGDKIKVVGEVVDLAEEYNSADLVLIPIFDGAGMKVKTAEALMYGKNIVGTKEAFEGYEVPFAECNGKNEFIEAIIYYYKSNVGRFNEEARKRYEEKYSIKSANEKLSKILF